MRIVPAAVIRPRHEGDVRGVLGESRAGRWFAENDRMDAFDFVADVGASELVPEVRAGQLVGASAGQQRK